MTSRCETHLFTEAELKATAFDVLDCLAHDEDFNFDTDEIEHVRYAFAFLIKELIEEV